MLEEVVMPTKIKCLCGDVELELSGEPMAQVYCHCEGCQKAHSAAYGGISEHAWWEVPISVAHLLFATCLGAMDFFDWRSIRKAMPEKLSLCVP